MGKKPAIFIAASGQNEGKTTSCLGILSGLLKRFDRVGFIKPVGQEHVTCSGDIKVDKDVILFKEQFNLSASYTSMSPVIFDRGFTKDYIDGKISTDKLKEKILRAYHEIEESHDCIVIEGTGHVGVGSIAGINNAEVAKLLNLNLILVSSGGLGSTFDNIMLNKALCDLKGVSFKGVIINRILDEKRDVAIDYLRRSLTPKQIPLIGTIPYDRLLMTFCMKDFETLFSMPILSGEIHKMRHFDKTRLVATSVETYQRLIQNKQLIITPSTREDIIIATLKAFWNKKVENPDEEIETGFIFTGSSPPTDRMVEQLRKANIPALYSKLSSFNAMKKITGFTAKLRIEDGPKIHEAISLVERSIDFEALIDVMRG